MSGIYPPGHAPICGPDERVPVPHLFTRRYYDGPRSDHFDGTRFFNPGGIEPADLRSILRWRMQGDPAPWPDRFDSPLPKDKPPAVVDGERLRLTYIGHAGFLLQTAGVNILLDPVYSRRCSPFSFLGPKRHADPGIAFDDLPKIDIVCLSHSHYDHLDASTVAALQKRFSPRFVVPLGVDALLRGWHRKIDVEAFDWHDRVGLADGLHVTLDPTHHWSARGILDRRRTLWTSFAFETPAGLFYYVGDTGVHRGTNFIAARQRYGPAKLAVLPIGAYEPRYVMAPQHQEPDEAVRAARFLEAEMAIGSHWGYFKLTDEAVDDPPMRLAAALEKWDHPAPRFVAGRPGLVHELPHRIDAPPVTPLEISAETTRQAGTGQDRQAADGAGTAT